MNGRQIKKGLRSSKNPDRAFLILCKHCVATLPDSLSSREELLDALLAGAPRTPDLAGRLRQMQWHLQEHRKTQEAFGASDKKGEGIHE